jgi:hypothetical protein
VVAKDDQDRQDRSRQLADAQRQVDTAQQEVEEARREVERFQRLDAGTVYRFIEDRYTSSDYRRYLGIVALIQRDFHQLSKRLVPPSGKNRPDGGQGGSPLPQIDRIVLYIDDLDRCPPNKVVNVLQAVHLLLAFPLFVVVVGVDSRWLLQSLRHEYSALLTSAANDTFSEDEPDYWASTPQNYLEKIFQIPYWIRPMDKDGYIQLVGSLIASDARVRNADALVLKPPPPTSGRPPMDDAVPPPSSQPTETSPHVASPSPTDGPQSGSRPRAEERPTPPPGAVESEPEGAAAPPTLQEGMAPTEEVRDRPRRDLTIDLVPNTLVITPDEQAFIEALAPLIPTPRVAKRFINTYRLLRASATDRGALEGGTGPEQYQVGLLLLAIMNGFPSQTSTLFRELMNADDRTWPEFIDGLRPVALATDVSGSTEAPSPERQAQAVVALEFASRILGKMRRVQAIPWLRLCQSLDEIHSHLTMTELAAFRAWIPRVARYSFEAGRVAEYDRNRDPAYIHRRRVGADETA